MSNTNTAIEKRQSETVNIPQRAQEQEMTYYTPLVDIYETAEGFVFQADMPGVKAGDVDVSYENGALTMEGKVAPRQPGAGYAWREYGVGHFYRSFNINTPIDVDGIRAVLKNGELTITVPKAESARTKKIRITGG